MIAPFDARDRVRLELDLAIDVERSIALIRPISRRR
jgi:hypothetical protein